MYASCVLCVKFVHTNLHVHIVLCKWHLVIIMSLLSS